ncbi:DOT1-domain-containing protein [Trametopsis cervina]|nr:DOT1-domain-containing protein [Trametopsis cervina]
MAAPGADFSFFSKSKANKPAGSGTTVTTRVVTKQVVNTAPNPAQGSGAVKVVARDATPSTSTSVGIKRRPEASAVPSRVKKARTSASPSAGPSSRASSLAPSVSTPELVRESSVAPRQRKTRSRSFSTTPEDRETIPRTWWTEEDGAPGPGFLSAECVVKDIMKDYKAFFRNPDDPSDTSFEPHPTHYPVAELEYPNTGASERFILLTPKDKDHYDPIMCLESSLYTIIETYLTPEQQSLFGTLPDKTYKKFIADSTPEPDHIREDSSSSHSTVSTPESISSVPSTSSVSSASSAASIFSTISAVSSLSSISELQSFAEPCTFGPPTVDYLNLLQRAIRKRNGPLFLKVVDAINALLRALKYPAIPPDPFDPSPPNILRDAVKSFPSSKLPSRLLLRIIEETYQRTVGPHVSELSRYEAFSSEVYGELLPPFVTEIIKTTGISQNTLFVDLGSGVGNVLLQASLATGCRSYGIELMPAPAKLARKQLEQFRTRCRMWGLQHGEIELEEGDMLESTRAHELLKQADVVLVNNKVFKESLNEALRSKFLDLKDGAIVVSLQPFVSPSRTVTERNSHDISGIFKVTERSYYAGSVSWSSFPGSYYLHRVDREELKRMLAEYNAPGRATRATRSRR